MALDGYTNFLDWMTHKDVGPQHLDMDYDIQLNTIRELLGILRQHLKEVEFKISELESLAAGTRGSANDYAVEEWVYHMHFSTYQEAAYSMTAVSMIAPFIEAIFRQYFEGRGNPIVRGSLVDSIMIRTKETGISDYMPPYLEHTLRALFEYRNKMLHFGLEWPDHKLRKFKRRLESSGRDSWFDYSTANDEPTMLYMSSEFVLHCLNTVEEIIDGMAKFDFENMPHVCDDSQARPRPEPL